MIGQHFVWFVLTMVCVAWYSTITIYVAIKEHLGYQANAEATEQQREGSVRFACRSAETPLTATKWDADRY